MKKINLLLMCFVGFSLLSCSGSDDESNSNSNNANNNAMKVVYYKREYTYDLVKKDTIDKGSWIFTQESLSDKMIQSKCGTWSSTQHYTLSTTSTIKKGGYTRYQYVCYEKK